MAATVDNLKKISLVNVKGGQEKYSGQKSDMKLAQHGGEGGGKEGKIPSGSDSSLLLKKPDSKYCGEGRYLKTE